MTRFVFGRDVIEAARTAFADAPENVPRTPAVNVKDELYADDRDVEQNRALAAMEDAAKSTGNWLVGTAGTVGGGVATGAVAVAGVATAAETVLRPFRSVDIDGDGIPDEPQAFTAVKSVGGAISGKAGSVGDSVAGLFKRKKRGEQKACESDVERQGVPVK